MEQSYFRVANVSSSAQETLCF